MYGALLMHKQNKPSAAISVDLIRVIAVLGVILLHATIDLTTKSTGLHVLRWWMVDIYQCFGRMGVPLFLMLSGSLLLGSSKWDEDLSSFFKKRFIRIGLPFIFWSIIFFFWAFYVENQLLTWDFIIKGILGGPYFILWYLYMLVGLYFVTPLLRVMVAHFTDKLFKYFIYLWLISATISPLIGLASSDKYQLNTNLFLIPLFLGYFVAGAYFVNVQVRRRVLVFFTVLGLALSAIATCLLAIYIGGGTQYFFQEYYSPTMILASVAFFILLNSYAKPQSPSQMEKLSWKQRIMRLISENTLPIYLLHMIVIYALQTGFFFGFTLTGDVVNSIIGVPIMTALTLALCLLIIVPLKKIPGLNKLIG